MLSRLLELLRAGGTRRIGGLAEELETTPQLVQAMLEDLARMGYIGQLNARCTESCSKCPTSHMCAVGAPSSEEGDGRIWVLLENRRPSGETPQ